MELPSLAEVVLTDTAGARLLGLVVCGLLLVLVVPLVWYWRCLRGGLKVSGCTQSLQQGKETEQGGPAENTGVEYAGVFVKNVLCSGATASHFNDNSIAHLEQSTISIENIVGSGAVREQVPGSAHNAVGFIPPLSAMSPETEQRVGRGRCSQEEHRAETSEDIPAHVSSCLPVVDILPFVAKHKPPRSSLYRKKSVHTRVVSVKVDGEEYHYLSDEDLARIAASVQRNVLSALSNRAQASATSKADPGTCRSTVLGINVAAIRGCIQLIVNVPSVLGDGWNAAAHVVSSMDEVLAWLPATTQLSDIYTQELVFGKASKITHKPHFNEHGVTATSLAPVEVDLITLTHVYPAVLAASLPERNLCQTVEFLLGCGKVPLLDSRAVSVLVLNMCTGSLVEPVAVEMGHESYGGGACKVVLNLEQLSLHLKTWEAVVLQVMLVAADGPAVLSHPAYLLLLPADVAAPLNVAAGQCQLLCDQHSMSGVVLHPDEVESYLSWAELLQDMAAVLVALYGSSTAALHTTPSLPEPELRHPHPLHTPPSTPTSLTLPPGQGLQCRPCPFTTEADRAGQAGHAHGGGVVAGLWSVEPVVSELVRELREQQLEAAADLLVCAVRGARAREAGQKESHSLSSPKCVDADSPRSLNHTQAGLVVGRLHMDVWSMITYTVLSAGSAVVGLTTGLPYCAWQYGALFVLSFLPALLLSLVNVREYMRHRPALLAIARAGPPIVAIVTVLGLTNWVPPFGSGPGHINPVCFVFCVYLRGISLNISCASLMLNVLDLMACTLATFKPLDRPSFAAQWSILAWLTNLVVLCIVVPTVASTLVNSVVCRGLSPPPHPSTPKQSQQLEEANKGWMGDSAREIDAAQGCSAFVSGADAAQGCSAAGLVNRKSRLAACDYSGDELGPPQFRSRQWTGSGLWASCVSSEWGVTQPASQLTALHGCGD